ncbi:MAG TPA: hypothetical protein VGG75_11795 [Trebonia sp.]
MRRRKLTGDFLRSWLASLAREELIAEILELADADSRLRLQLELKAATQTRDAGQLRHAVKRLLQTGDYLAGQEAPGYADDVSRAAEAIGSLLETDDEAVGVPDAGAAVALARDALGWVTHALANADDSSGVISDSAAELLALHLSACQVTEPPPDPVELGRYLADLILRDTRGITPALEDYSALLGRAGVLAIRERIAAVHRDDPGNPNARYLANTLLGTGTAQPPDQAPPPVKA